MEVDLPVHLMIGIAGMALGDAIIMDPSPCPWFVNDGSAISAREKEELKGNWKEIQSILNSWIERDTEKPTEADWNVLTKGWRSGLFYRSTMLMCKALISDGYYRSVADCMLDEPLAVYEKMSRLQMEAIDYK